MLNGVNFSLIRMVWFLEAHRSQVEHRIWGVFPQFYSEEGVKKKKQVYVWGPRGFANYARLQHEHNSARYVTERVLTDLMGGL